MAFPAIDLREARELQMINPRYAGVDRLDRPFVVTAAVGRQVPNRQRFDVARSAACRRSRLLAGRRPSCSPLRPASTSRRRSSWTCSARSTLVHQNGTRFVTRRARVDARGQHRRGPRPGRGARALRATSRRKASASSTKATRSSLPAVRPAAERRQAQQAEQGAAGPAGPRSSTQRGRGRGAAGAIPVARSRAASPGRQAGRCQASRCQGGRGKAASGRQIAPARQAKDRRTLEYDTGGCRAAGHNAG